MCMFFREYVYVNFCCVYGHVSFLLGVYVYVSFFVVYVSESRLLCTYVNV